MIKVTVLPRVLQRKLFLPGTLTGCIKAGKGTINIIAETNTALSEAALAEALMIITEARCRSLIKFGFRSRVSDNIARGTGTDSNLVFSRKSPGLHFCGKQTLLGEMLAGVVIKALDEVIRIIRQMDKNQIIKECLYSVPT